MGRIVGTCQVCGRISYDIRRCPLCGATVCSRCFQNDAHSCIKCLRKGLWVGDKSVE